MRPSVPLPRALTALTFVSGFVDAVSFLGLGRVFTANMTGNLLIFGFAVAGAPGLSVHGALVSFAFFLLGAVLAGRLARLPRERDRRRWLRASMATESALLALAAGAAFTAAHGPPYPVIALLALAMGMRNATIRKLAVRDMTTTVQTLTVAGLASDSTFAGGDNERAARRTASVVALVLGAASGAWLVLNHGAGWPLLLCSLTVGLLALLLRGAPPDPG